MVTALVVCCGLLSALPAEADAGGPAPDLAAYEAAYEDARAKVGRDADAHVRLALWCEAHGLPAGRLKHLAIAALIEPGHATARGLMGLVAHAGGWRRPEAVADKLKADAAMAATLEQYKARRDKAPMKADAQWRLAQWCEENGLEAESKAHLVIVTRIDPNHAAARRRLGYKKQGGRWVTDAQLAEERADADLQKKADRAWKPRLEKWRDMLASKDTGKRVEAERAMLEVTDPRAVPAVWAVFGKGSEGRQAVAVQLLGQIDGPVASRALVSLAVFSPAANVRQIAMQTLSRRDPRDFVGLLVDRVRDPIKYEVRPVGGPGSQGVLFVEGKEYNVRRIYGTPAVHPQGTTPRIFAPSVPFDPFSMQNVALANGAVGISRGVTLSPQALSGLAADPRNAPSIFAQEASNQFSDPRIRYNQYLMGDTGEYVLGDADREGNLTPDSIARLTMIAAARRDLELGLIENSIRRANLEAQQRLRNDVAFLEQTNSSIHEMNGRLLPVLEAATGQSYGEDRSAWQAWWTDQEGYALAPQGSTYKPTFDETVAVPFATIPITPFQVSTRIHSCFGAGTRVHTRAGSVAIEDVKLGDQILTQDTRTGALSFQPVLAAIHNPPNRTLRITLGDESVVATGIHRFWKAGQGWVMTRELKVGDPIRTLGGVARVTAVTEAEDQPVFNLEVARGHDFFVSEQGALVHDNSVVRPTPEPFDAAPELAAVAPAP